MQSCQSHWWLLLRDDSRLLSSQNQVSCLIYSLIYTTTSVLSQIVAPPKQEMCSPEAVNATLLGKRLLADFEIKNLEVGLTCIKVSPKSDDKCPGKSS